MVVLTDLHPPLRIKRIIPKPVYPFPFRLAVDPWAEEHGILLIGTNQGATELYYDGFDETLTVDPAGIDDGDGRSYREAMEALKLLPDHVIVGMEPQYNYHSGGIETKAIYFSTASGLGYANNMPYGYSEEVLVGVHTGFILEQWPAYRWFHLALHECGHIVDLVGTNRGGYYWEPIWNLADEIDLIFDVEGELISQYAKTNSREDFAEHFAYYVWKGTTFRVKAQTNPDLEERYTFLRDQLFQGVEYEEPSGILWMPTVSEEVQVEVKM